MRGLKLAAICVALGFSAALSPAETREIKRENTVRSATAAKPAPRAAHRTQRGRASFYANNFHGKRMANGERFNRNSNAAASRTLPLGTRAQVKNLENGRTAVVTIQDRGPFKRGRVIDVSPRIASQLGMRDAGVVMVEVVPLSIPSSNPG